MRGVLLDVPERMLTERRLGIDGRDEMWEGVVHMVPPASERHQRLGTDLLLVLGPLAKQLGLLPYYETGLFRNVDDYRVPDLLFCRTEHICERGTQGAELVVELRSPRDETCAKLEPPSQVRCSTPSPVVQRTPRTSLMLVSTTARSGATNADADASPAARATPTSSTAMAIVASSS